LTAKVISQTAALQEYSDNEVADIILRARENAVDVVLLCGPRIRRRSLVRRVKEAGFQIGAWGVAADLTLARRLMELQLDRFTLDNPELL
jgi:glycerophosphoryl diester phosphodiesterase